LILYCGKVLNDEGKEVKLLIDFEPYKPINTSLYFCDSKFHVDELGSLLETESPFGFIVMDGQGALYATLQGNTKTVSLHLINYSSSLFLFRKLINPFELY